MFYLNDSTRLYKLFYYRKLMGKKKVGKFVVDMSHCLGTGTYGEVFLAEHQQTKQQAAVKIIKKQSIGQDSYQKAALIRQIQIMKHLKSQNIIQLLQISETSSNIYIFQELANQGTLEDLLHKNRRFSQKVALGYIRQILNGFTELIKHGIIHRDIKSSNILIKDDLPKIADFGMSRYSGKSSFMVSYVGTPFYMAPQILRQQPYSYKCDIWSLGVLFYQLVTGTVPWKIQKTSTLEQLTSNIEQQCKTGVIFPKELEISEMYKDLVNGCLKYAEADRYNWENIMNHKILQGNFVNASLASSNFILTDLRLKVHSNNLNLEKMIKKLPEKLNKSDFFNVLKAINGAISPKDSDDLFKIISKCSDSLDLKSLTQYFQNHGIKLTGLKTSVEQKQDKTHILLQKLSKSIQEKEIDLFDLYKQFAKKKQNRLEKQQFHQLIKSICGDFKLEDVEELFFLFNGKEHLGYILFENMYQNICKAMQVPAYKDQEISKEIKKLEDKTKKH